MISHQEPGSTGPATPIRGIGLPARTTPEEAPEDRPNDCDDEDEEIGESEGLLDDDSDDRHSATVESEGPPDNEDLLEASLRPGRRAPKQSDRKRDPEQHGTPKR